MSIHVTVSGNPVYLGRGRVFLTDIETAKKNEWLRRRKIRLQQARQQAKDLTSSVRKKVSCEENALQKDEEERETEEQNRKREEQIISLQNEYQKSLSAVGTGHHLASMQEECDALAREKQDLRDAIAKARGAIAEERIKAEKCIKKEISQISVGRKKMVRQMEDLRSAVVSNLPEVKNSVSQTKSSTIKVQVHRSEEPEDECEPPVCSKKVVSPTRKFSQCSGRRNERFKTRASLSPPRSARNPLSSRGKSCNVAEDESDEDESDDSDVTWPPRSARVTKEPIVPVEPPRVRFYDHNARIVKQTPRPCYSIKKADPFEEPDMCEAIAEEEEAIVRKENLDILARREKMIRGNKALKQERGRREAEKFLKELREMHRKEKIQMAVNRTYPSDLHMRDCRRKEMEVKKQAELHKSIPLPQGIAIKPPMPTCTNQNGIKIKNCDQPAGGVRLTRLDSESPKTKEGNAVSPSKFYQDSSTDNEEFFRELVDKLKAERARQQQELDAKFGAIHVEEEDIPQWIKCHQQEPGPSGIRVAPAKQDRAVSPVKHQTVCEVCSCTSRCPHCPRDDNTIMKKKDKEERRNSVHYEEIDQQRNSVHYEANGQQRNSVSPDEGGNSTNIDEELPKDSTTENLPSGSGGNGRSAIEGQPIGENKKKPENDYVAVNSSRQSTDGAELECEMISSKSSSHSDAVESSMTFEGIKVTVKVSEKVGKKKDKVERSPVEHSPKTTDKDIQTSLELCEDSPVNRNMTWNNRFSSSEPTSSGSTSYMSPPNKLSPAHQALLRAILGKIDSKNKNPRLHQYIKRVLDMSRKSIDELSVSSVSDVSISNSVFDRSTRRRSSSISNSPKVCKCCVPPQAHANVSDDSTTKEALKFSEMAEGYAHRVQDLAKMMERIRILPDCRVGEETEDSCYMSPPPEVHHSVRLSQSVKAGHYPSKLANESDGVQRASPCQDLPPAHIYPHPSNATHFHPPSSHSSNSRKLGGLGPAEVAPHELSTIQECGESQRPETPQPRGFDPDISSIRGSPRQHESRDSTGSSLCLLDDRDVSSWLGSSSDNFEEVFKSLGIAWALPTVRKTRQSQRRTSDSQSSGRGQYSHSTPLGQSPAKPSCHGSNCRDSDSLTPPSLSLNIPQSVWHKHRLSK